MSANLLKTKRFLPLLVTQFLGALNDNLFKNALLTLVTIKMTSQSDILSNMIAGLFILPFFLFSATAGQVADKFPRDKIARVLKITEVILMLLVAFSYMLQSLPLLVITLGLMGSQSAFFGPVKYSLLPQHLETHELVAGNAYVESSTYGAILLGLFMGTILPIYVTIFLLVSLAIVGYFASRYIPFSPAPRPSSRVSINIFMAIKGNFLLIKKHQLILRTILGSTWFWMVGSLIVVQVYPLAGKILNASEGVIALFLIVFSLGVGVGSYACNKILKGFIHATYVPLSAVGMGLGLFMLYVLSNNYPTPAETVTFWSYWFLPHALGIVISLFIIAFFGGVYVIPLNAMMQSRSPKAYVASVIAGNNIVNAFGMVVVALVAVVLLSFGVSVPELFLIMGVLSLILSVYISSLLPDAFVRSIVQAILRFFFKSKVTGLSHFKRAGKRVLIVSNHVSLLDGVMLAAFMPERITFAINTTWTQKWFMPIIRILVDFYPVDPNNPLSIRSLIEEVKKGRKVMMFPEGRVTVTGSMMKVYEGAGMVAAKANAKILPVRISGAQYSKFSYLKNKFKSRWFPEVSLNILEAEKFELPKGKNSRQTRYLVSKKLYELMSGMMYQTSDIDDNIITALHNAAKLHGKNHKIIQDFEQSLSYKELIKRSKIMALNYKSKLIGAKEVGICLPTGVQSLVAFFALHYLGKTPVFVDSMASQNMPVISADDELLSASSITCRLRAIFYKKPTLSKQAVVFDQKAISHRNLQAMYHQFLGVFPFNKSDTVLNPLPLNNSFGFIYALIIPILSGSKVILYPFSNHLGGVSELCYDSQATVLFGSNELFAKYAETAHAYDFFSLKYAISAQDKLQEDTFDLWVKKFGVRLLESLYLDDYCTMVATNSPIYNKQQTYGCLLPAIKYRLTEDNKIEVRGDNFGTNDWQFLPAKIELDDEGFLCDIK